MLCSGGRDQEPEGWMWSRVSLGFIQRPHFYIYLWSGWQVGFKIRLMLPMIHLLPLLPHVPLTLAKKCLGIGVGLHDGDSGSSSHLKKEKITECSCAGNDPGLCTEWSDGLNDPSLICFKKWKVILSSHGFIICKLSGIWLPLVL